MQTIIDSDSVVVLDAGRVIEAGSPQELLARPGSVFGAMAREGVGISQ